MGLSEMNHKCLHLSEETKIRKTQMLSKRSFISSKRTKTILLKIDDRICHFMQMDLQIQVEQVVHVLNHKN